ncbi:MAG: FHA domain-containing protein [Candidatus Omnitrophica bacterium]|nr:FHA domain-containing protein [Candidatus Omnitrophota bacterium]
MKNRPVTLIAILMILAMSLGPEAWSLIGPRDEFSKFARERKFSGTFAGASAGPARLCVAKWAGGPDELRPLAAGERASARFVADAQAGDYIVLGNVPLYLGKSEKGEWAITDASGRRYALKSGVMNTVGRGLETNDVALPDTLTNKAISHRHAGISIGYNAVKIYDLGSANGVAVKRNPLDPGDLPIGKDNISRALEDRYRSGTRVVLAGDSHPFFNMSKKCGELAASLGARKAITHLGLELPKAYQEDLDKLLRHWRLRNTWNRIDLATYAAICRSDEKIVRYITRAYGPYPAAYFGMLQAAYENGVKVTAIDNRITEEDHEGRQNDAGMLKNIAEVLKQPDARMLVFIGAMHANKNSAPAYPGDRHLGALLKEKMPQVKPYSVYLWDNEAAEGDFPLLGKGLGAKGLLHSDFLMTLSNSTVFGMMPARLGRGRLGDMYDAALHVSGPWVSFKPAQAGVTLSERLARQDLRNIISEEARAFLYRQISLDVKDVAIGCENGKEIFGRLLGEHEPELINAGTQTGGLRSKVEKIRVYDGVYLLLNSYAQAGKLNIFGADHAILSINPAGSHVILEAGGNKMDLSAFEVLAALMLQQKGSGGMAHLAMPFAYNAKDEAGNDYTVSGAAIFIYYDGHILRYNYGFAAGAKKWVLEKFIDGKKSSLLVKNENGLNFEKLRQKGPEKAIAYLDGLINPVEKTVRVAVGINFIGEKPAIFNADSPTIQNILENRQKIEEALRIVYKDSTISLDGVKNTEVSWCGLGNTKAVYHMRFFTAGGRALDLALSVFKDKERRDEELSNIGIIQNEMAATPGEDIVLMKGSPVDAETVRVSPSGLELKQTYYCTLSEYGGVDIKRLSNILIQLFAGEKLGEGNLYNLVKIGLITEEESSTLKDDANGLAQIVKARINRSDIDNLIVDIEKMGIAKYFELYKRTAGRAVALDPKRDNVLIRYDRSNNKWGARLIDFERIRSCSVGEYIASFEVFDRAFYEETSRNGLTVIPGTVRRWHWTDKPGKTGFFEAAMEGLGSGREARNMLRAAWQELTEDAAAYVRLKRINPDELKRMLDTVSKLSLEQI